MKMGNFERLYILCISDEEVKVRLREKQEVKNAVYLRLVTLPRPCPCASPVSGSAPADSAQCSGARRWYPGYPPPSSRWLPESVLSHFYLGVSID